MAVDVKTLRIGSHVEYENKRMIIASVSGKIMNANNLTLIDLSPLTLYRKVNGYDVNPIPITPELLAELGFEQDMRFAYGKAFKMECGEMWIGVSAMSKSFWRIEAMDDTYNYGNCIIRYLHEAESFLGLHNIELIKE